MLLCFSQHDTRHVTSNVFDTVSANHLQKSRYLKVFTTPFQVTICKQGQRQKSIQTHLCSLFMNLFMYVVNCSDLYYQSEEISPALLQPSSFNCFGFHKVRRRVLLVPWCRHLPWIPLPRLTATQQCGDTFLALRRPPRRLSQAKMNYKKKSTAGGKRQWLVSAQPQLGGLHTQTTRAWRFATAVFFSRTHKRFSQ